MDIFHFHRNFRLLNRLQTSLERFTKNSPKPTKNPEIIKIARGMGLLAISALLGLLSNSATEKRTREEVLNREWPDVTIWRNTLRSAGWSPFETNDLSLLLKNHPNPVSESADIWISENKCFIFVPKSPYSKPDARSEGPELWACATGREQPKSVIKWHKIGGGYDGVNQLARIKLPTAKKQASYIDPKEIRY
jgi:hypothetical protein